MPLLPNAESSIYRLEWFIAVPCNPLDRFTFATQGPALAVYGVSATSVIMLAEPLLG